MADSQAGWYDDGSGTMRWWDGNVWTDAVQPPAPPEPGITGMINRAQADAVSGAQPRPAPTGMSYVVLQVVLKEKFFGNMSKRAAEMLREEIDFMGPVRIRDVEEAQQKIVNIIRKLEESGDIVVARAGEEELVV